MAKTLMAPGKRAAIYCRISDDRESDELGVTRQQEDAEAFAATEGLTVIGVYIDNDISASTQSRKTRPRYNQLLKDARAGLFDVVIAYTSARLTRRPRENEDLIDLAVEHGIRYRFLRSPSFDLNTADGRQVARMLAANDAAEAERTAERTQRAALQRAATREPHGGPRLYGISADGRSLIEHEAERIREWFAIIVAGGTIDGIRKQLVRDAVPTSQGGTWRHSSLRWILHNTRMAGFRVVSDKKNGDKEYATPHPAIVDREVWQAAQDVLNRPDRYSPKRTRAKKWIGSGVYICLRCGDALNIGYTHKQGIKNRIYRSGCGRSWKAEPIDAWIGKLVESVIGAEDAAERLLPRQNGNAVDVPALRTEATALRARLDQLAVSFADGHIDGDQLRAGSKRFRERLAEIDQIVTDASRVDPVASIVMADDPVAAWRAITDVSRRQAIIRALMTIELGAPLIGATKWDARAFISITPLRGTRRPLEEARAERPRLVLVPGGGATV